MSTTINSTTRCIVKNRSASTVVYRIPEENIRREFAPGESKNVLFSEIEKLTYQPGGQVLLGNFLQINNVKQVEDLGIKTEPEYFMDEKQVVELLTSGTLDAFLDCLDFAPEGVIDLVKRFSVSLPLQDYNKRKALKEKTGFDVDKAIANIEAEKAEEREKAETVVRRVQANETAPASPVRRTSGNNYKVVTPKSE